ncbi:hypothetical protein BC477_12425 [Clavibacter michiganensis subsp. michiganensis]|nr:hypothetical protein BC477_12425 [Clavibacter michiganensis subsp. michiganensis]
MSTISNRRRIAFSLIAILAVIGVFVVKLIDIQVVQATELNEEALGKRAISQTLPGVRAASTTPTARCSRTACSATTSRWIRPRPATSPGR